MLSTPVDHLHFVYQVSCWCIAIMHVRILYCKQYIRYLPHTTVIQCYGLCKYRGVFTVGVVATNGTSVTRANALTDYSYINARGGDPNGAVFARCLTGLGPTSTSRNANGDLGGLYFNGTMIPNSDESASRGSNVILVRPKDSIAGVTNIQQCGVFTTDYEGVYTCTMMNSAMMNQSVRFGIYLNGRSE